MILTMPPSERDSAAKARPPAAPESARSTLLAQLVSLLHPLSQFATHPGSQSFFATISCRM